MVDRLRSHITYANVVSTMCLFILLGGGAYAAHKIKLPKGSVGAKQLKKNAVRSPKVKDHTLLAADAKPGEFATPSDLVGLDAGKLGGIGPAGFVHGAGSVVSAEFTGTSRGGPLVAGLPGGASIDVECDASGYTPTFHGSGDRDYDVFQSVFSDGVTTVEYTRITPSTLFVVYTYTDPREIEYDISSDAGYASVKLWGDFDNSSKVCTLKARGLKSS